MSRLERFNELATHPWLGRLHAQLSKVEIALAHAFLIENSELDKGAFEMKANRLWLDGGNKPKHANIIVELLICANSAKETN